MGKAELVLGSAGGCTSLQRHGARRRGMLRLRVAGLAALAASLCPPCPAATRTWKDSRGREVEAEFVSLDNGRVTLRSESGETVTVSLSDLSNADRGVAESLARSDSPNPGAGVRVWTDHKGKKVRASLVAVQDGKAVLDADGKEIRVALSNLSDQDREFAQRAMSAGPAAPSPRRGKRTNPRADTRTEASPRRERVPEPVNELPPAIAEMGVERGPMNGPLGEVAGVEIPKGYAYADPEATKELMTRMGNPLNGSELAIVAPNAFDWFVVFEFSEVGYVKDDDRDDLDDDALLKNITKATEAANKQRREMGGGELHVTGWHTSPRYNSETNNLEWAIEAEGGGEKVVNYNVRLLGRRGVMELSLVADPSQMKTALPAFRKLMDGFSYNEGSRYGDYVSGDRVATYGLAALIAGGGLAVAAKTGLLRHIIKLIWLPFAALGAFLKRMTGNRDR